MEESITKRGFGKSICSFPSDSKYAFHQRNAKHMTLNQIEECDGDNMIVSVGNGMSFSHTLEVENGNHACEAVEHAIKSSKNL